MMHLLVRLHLIVAQQVNKYHGSHYPAAQFVHFIRWRKTK